MDDPRGAPLSLRTPCWHHAKTHQSSPHRFPSAGRTVSHPASCRCAATALGRSTSPPTPFRLPPEKVQWYESPHCVALAPLHPCFYLARIPRLPDQARVRHPAFSLPPDAAAKRSSLR